MEYINIYDIKGIDGCGYPTLKKRVKKSNTKIESDTITNICGGQVYKLLGKQVGEVNISVKK